MGVALERPASAVARAIEDAIARARERGESTLLSVYEPLGQAPDPIAFLGAVSLELGDGILWSQTADGRSFAGAGAALKLAGTGPSRFGAVSAAVRDLRGRVVRADDAPFPIVGGFAFGEIEGEESLWSNLPDALLTIPRLLLQSGENGSGLRITVLVTPISSSGSVQDEIDALLRVGRASCRVQDGSNGWDPGLAPATRSLGTRATLASPVRNGVSSAPSPPIQVIGAWGHGTDEVLGGHSVPSREAWQASVATAVALIRQGALDKVVLAKEERLHARDPFSPMETLSRLRAADPATTLFAIQSGGSWFLGATPERLVRLNRGRVDVTALAGSIGIGATPEERQVLAARLLASGKDRSEHEIVVESTLAALAEVCEDVRRESGTPRVVTARSVQHLATPISGRLASAGQVLDLVERLHPTPAVGGFPRAEALSVIRELEQIERGWYAGPVGWTDLDGSGEFSVAIRSALLRGQTASVFAGCGIVADSDPVAEFAETWLKMRPMLAALGAA